MEKLKLVIFDLDGTIVDSDKTVVRILNTIRKDLELPPIKFKDISFLLSLGGEKMIHQIIESKKDLKKYLKIFRDRYLDDSLCNEKLFDGAINYLNYLKDKGIVMAIFTNKPKDLTNKTLKRHQIENFFKYVVTSDDVILKKPNPEGIHKIIKMSKFSEENTIMIGDSMLDLQAANLASIPFFYHDVLSKQEVLDSNDFKKFNNFNDLIE